MQIINFYVDYFPVLIENISIVIFIILNKT